MKKRTAAAVRFYVHSRIVCHREGQSPVAISWYILHISTQYQEIAAPLRARNDRGDLMRVLLLWVGQVSERVGGHAPPCRGDS